MKKITLLSIMLILLAQFTYSQSLISKRIKINNPTKEQLLKVREVGIDLSCGAVFDNNNLILELGGIELNALDNQGISYSILVEDLIDHYKKKNDIELPIAKAELAAKKAQKVASKSLSTKSESIDNFIQYEGCSEVNWSVPTNFNLGSMGGCLTYSEVLAELDQMRALYPNLISVKTDASPGTVTNGNSFTDGPGSTVYDTWAGQPIYYVRISDNPDTDEANEPESLYSGMTHSREVSSMMNLIYYMWYVLENYGSDAGIKNLVDNHEMYFIPVANPDGLMWNEQIAPSGGGLQRKNLGDYNTGDNALRGVDLNRNYDYFWGSHAIYANGTVGSSGSTNSNVYRGPSAFSEPETQIVRDFSATREFKTAMNHHASSNLIPHSYNGYPGSTGSGRESEYHKFCHDMTRFNRYIYGEAPDILTIANGDMSDWMLGGATDLNGSTGSGQGILALAPENGSWITADGEGGFWPNATKIVEIAQRAVRMNFVNAYHSGKFAQFHDLNPSDINTTSGNLEFGLEYLGQTIGNITLNVTPVSGNITSITPPLTQTGWSKLEQRTVTAAYTLDAGIQPNDEIEFQVTLSNDDGYVMYQANIIKLYNPSVLFTDNPDIDNLTNWTASGGSWGTITTTDYNGNSTTAITDSPSGAYGNNQSKTLTLNSSIDISSSSASIVQFFAKWDLERNFDYVQIEGSTNGTTWIPLCGKYSKPGSSRSTNRYSSTYSSNTSTGKSTSDQNNQPTGESIYDADTMDKWVMEEILIDGTENNFLFGASNARFRFVFDSDNTNRADGYPTTFDGFIFDDFKIINVEIPCVLSVPTNVTISSINTTSASVSWDNIPSATYDLRYKEISSGTWIDVTDLTSSNYNLTGLIVSTDYEVQVRSKCTSSNSAFSASTNFTTLAVSYCDSFGNNTDAYTTAITLVNLNDGSSDLINFASVGTTASSYTDNTSPAVDINIGDTATLTVNLNTDGNFTIHAYAWIDWNGNGDPSDTVNSEPEFYDLGIATNTADGPTSIQASIEVPASANIGEVRMRVSAKYNSDPTFCEENFDGEVEDYNLNILPSCTKPADDVTNATICSGETYVWAANGASYTTNQTGLTITNDGCTADDVLNLTVTPKPADDVTNATICSGETYVWAANGASYTSNQTGLTITNDGCTADDVLNLTVTPKPADDVTNATICSGETYVWAANGASYTTNQTGLTITNDGCTADDVLNLTVTPKPADDVTNATICSGETYVWAANGASYTSNQTGLTITNDGCTADDVLNLTVTPKPADDVTNATICSGETYVWAANGASYTSNQTGLTITNDGCTADDVLNLTVTPKPADDVTNATICSGETYVWAANGASYTTNQTGLTITNDGCTADDVLNLTVTPKPADDVTNATICSGETYVWAANGASYTTNQTGLTITNDGCTADDVLNLTVTPKPADDVTNATICSGETYVWAANGASYTTNQTGLTITNDGCTADDVLNLTVTPKPADDVTNATICSGETYVWAANGASYTSNQTGLTITNDGCTADDVLNLTVTPKPADDVTNATICSGETYVWAANGASYTTNQTGLTITNDGCTADDVLNLTVTPKPADDVTNATICSGETYVWAANGASYTSNQTGLTITNDGCTADDVLNLTVTPKPADDVTNATICSGETYVWAANGASYTSNQTGLTITNDGCTADDVLNLTVTPKPADDVTNATICSGETYVWAANGASYTTNQTGLTITNDGCTADDVLNLTVTPKPADDVTNATICSGETYVWAANGASYTTNQTGLTITNDGCTADDVLNLTVTPKPADDVTNATICSGETYVWAANGASYTSNQTGLTITNDGCTADDVLNLTVTPKPADDVTNATICSGETYVWAANGASYTTNQTGLTITNDGCTADDVLNLTVTPKPADDVTNATICSGETYVWAANGASYTSNQTGLTITNDGCTADDVLNLTVTPKPADDVTNATICSGETYVWAANGASYTSNQTGLTITNDGCTADDVLNLTVTPKPADDVTNATICSGETYVWAANGASYTSNQTGLTITNDGCTADDVLNLTITPQSTWYLDADNDNYADSTTMSCTSPGVGYTTTVLPVTDCDDTDDTIYPGAPEVINDGIDQDCDGSDQTTLDTEESSFERISVIPNPFNDSITIQLPLSLANSEFNIKVFDLNGRLVIDRKYSSINSKITVEDLDKLEQAPYLFKIINSKSGNANYKRLIKN